MASKATFIQHCLLLVLSSAKGLVIQSQGIAYDNGNTQWTSTQLGRPFDVFLGIPYALPPIGNLRFSLPRRIENKGQAYFVGANSSNPYAYSTCTQMDFQEILTGVEDCLHLNVFVPKQPKSNNGPLPVLFWIHGGGFFAGSASVDFFGPEHFMDHDVVFVSANYRLGALGFLTLENDKMPGNLGLHDQILALQWVQENIRSFGGDPERVTIAGESAGGMSVMFLLMSHQSKGLYSKAIIQSGPLISSYNVWDKRPKLYAKKLAQDLGCKAHENEDEALLACLRKIDAQVFAENTKHFLHYPWVGPNIWKPYYDGNTSNPLFKGHPEELLRNGDFNKVPILIGTNSDEGALNVVGYLDGRADFAEVNKKWMESLGPLILFHRSLDETSDWDRQMAQHIKNLYFGEDDISQDTIKQFIKLSGDHMFYGGTELVIRELAKHSDQDVFRYMYSHAGTLTLVDTFLLNRVVFLSKLFIEYSVGWRIADYGFGTCHADELFTMFQPHRLPFNSRLTAQDEVAGQRLLTYLVNFVTNGDPSLGEDVESRWEAVKSPEFQYLEINGVADHPPEMKYEEERKVRATFWSHIFDELHQRPRQYNLSARPPMTLQEVTSLSARLKDDL